MRGNKYLNVLYKEKKVGTLALLSGRKAAFEYDDAWIEEGFPISPFSLPLKKKVFIPTKDYFRGLFGVFADSLPDAWGNILLDRVLRKHGINPDMLNALDRLAIVGDSGMGALSYKPEYGIEAERSHLDLDDVAGQCQKILQSEYTEDLDEIYRLGGTSGGARPKIMTEIDGEEWIIKFPAHVDNKNIGKMEYDYSLCAKRCGIVMPETQLFQSGKCEGYFGVKRFDRRCTAREKHSERIHMLTAAALLELDFEQPSMDYHSLMKLTKILTCDNYEDIENMFRRMCFNVFAHNRDDHSKNFSFIYRETEDKWRLSPAYDLTYSTTYFGEHTTTIDGEGANPGRKELLAVGIRAGMGKAKCCEIMEEIETRVMEELGGYLL